MSSTPTASILIPTRDRPDYLEVTLASIAPQARAAGAELLVIDDGTAPGTRPVALRHGATVIAAPPPGGLNVARNAGIAAASGELLVFVDDDVRAGEGWLRALLAGAERYRDHGVFGGPITAALEGGGPRRCGRESPPITTLDLGPVDRDAELVWGANMALRRTAVEAVGPFDATLSGKGDEEEWERRYRATGGRIRYLAAAGLQHRRTAHDATLRRLSRAAFAQGRQARRYDVRKGSAPPASSELRVLAGCVWHTARRRCANGVVLAAHAAGRLRELGEERRT